MGLDENAIMLHEHNSQQQQEARCGVFTEPFSLGRKTMTFGCPICNVHRQMYIAPKSINESEVHYSRGAHMGHSAEGNLSTDPNHGKSSITIPSCNSRTGSYISKTVHCWALEIISK